VTPCTHARSFTKSGPCTGIRATQPAQTQTHICTQFHEIRAVYRHPGYEIDSRNDVAVLSLATPSRNKPVELYEGTDVGFTDCHAMTIHALTMLPNLEKKPVVALDHDECVTAYYWKYGSKGLIGNDLLCVGGNLTNCAGDVDFGAPLVSVTPEGRVMLLGITAYLNLCNGLPPIFTRISHVLPWILAATRDSMSVHLARKLTVKVDALALPHGGVLRIYGHGSAYQSGLASVLDSKCQAGSVSDDHGTGAMMIEYTPGPGQSFFDQGCDAACVKSYHFDLHVQQETCGQNFARTLNKSFEACVDPDYGGAEDDLGVGGIQGCEYVPKTQWSEAACVDPVCNLTLRWPHIGPMEVMCVCVYVYI
jgi:hypothetical protein